MSYLDALAEHFDSNLVGAYRGLVMLQETYNLDILQMAKGRVSYKGKVFQVTFHLFSHIIKSYLSFFGGGDILKYTCGGPTSGS